MADTAKRLLRAGVLAAALYAARRYCRNWGTTKEEAQMRCPGDELVRDPVVQTTAAMSIDTPTAAIWPWLLQIGRDRGGLYLPQMLGNLLGLRFHNANRLHAEWQRLSPGDRVQLAPEGWLGRPDGVVFTVTEIVPRERIVLHAGPPHLPWDAVWSFHLLPRWDNRSRLLLRARSGLRHPGQVLGMELARPLTAFGIRAMLCGIKRRAERLRPDATAIGEPPGLPSPSTA